jgi:hypothetical protein
MATPAEIMNLKKKVKVKFTLEQATNSQKGGVEV